MDPITNDKYVKLLDQDSYLIDPRDESRVPVLEADYDLCLNYVRMFFSQAEMVRVLYNKHVERAETQPASADVIAALKNAMDASLELAEKSESYPSTLAYSTHWLIRKPLMRVLIARMAQELPADTVA